MHTLEEPSHKWRGLRALFTICALCLGSAVFLAAPAEARTFYERPTPSWICKTFNICKTGTWIKCGNPNIAYNKTTPKCYRYTVRY